MTGTRRRPSKHRAPVKIPAPAAFVAYRVAGSHGLVLGLGRSKALAYEAALERYGQTPEMWAEIPPGVALQVGQYFDPPAKRGRYGS